jgi:hypothetical protein
MRSLLPPIWALSICLVVPSIAGAQDVYFSMGNEIRKLTLPSTITSVVHTNLDTNSNPVPVGDLALCAGDPANPQSTDPIQYLYFVEGTGGNERIRRLAIPGTLDVVSVTVSGAREIRLTKDCKVQVATTSGDVFAVDAALTGMPTLEFNAPAGADGSGLAIAFDGSLRVSDAASIFSSPPGSPAPDSETPIVGLGVANGGDGSAVAALSVGDVCASSANTIDCGPKPLGGALGTPLATFPITPQLDAAQFFEFLTDDRVVVATSVDPTAAINCTRAEHNGILRLIGPGTSVTELFRSPRSGGKCAPIVGVAVGPSDSQAVTTPIGTIQPGTIHRLNFGPVAFDVKTPQACRLSIQLRQLSWAQAQEKLDSVSPANLLDPGFGGESWIDNVVVTEVTPNACGVSPATPATVAIGQFNDNSQNRAVQLCHGDLCEVITISNYPFSTPDDSYNSGGADDFSNILTAIVPTTPDAIRILFSPPLNNAAVVQGAIDTGEIAAASRHNLSGGLSIRFRICANEACTMFLPAGTGARLSASKLNPQGVTVANCVVTDQGSSTPGNPVFRLDPDGITHLFNLETPMVSLFPPVGPDPCSQAGPVVFSASSDSGAFPPTSIVAIFR